MDRAEMILQARLKRMNKELKILKILYLNRFILQIENIIEIDNIRSSEHLKKAISPYHLSLKFESLFQENNISQFFTNLKTDLINQQYIMQQAILKLDNAAPDFASQSIIVQPGKKLNLKIRSKKNRISVEQV